MYEETVPAAYGLENVLGGAGATETLKQAGLVTGGVIVGKFLNKSTASMLSNGLVRGGVAAALGVLAGTYGANKANEMLEWAGIGIAADGIAALIAHFMPSLSS